MTSESQTLSSRELTAVERWKLGHHAFHLHLVAMNTGLAEALVMIDEEQWDDLTTTFKSLTTLYDAATASMAYTASFDSDIYENLIRPSMSEPFLSPGFSGQLNPEHEQMLNQLKKVNSRMRQHLETASSLPEELLHSWTALTRARRANNKNHMLICGKFVDGGRSLLRDFWRNKGY